MFELESSWWEVVLRTTIVYVTVVVGFRVTGKRQFGQMSPFDLVVLLLIANAVQNAMVGAEVSVSAGLISAATLLAINFVASEARDRSPFLERLLQGEPVVLVEDGRVLWPAMRAERVDREELEQAFREHGVEKPAEVKLATLEIDGTISIVPRGEGTAPRAPRGKKTKA